jgi:riboflavin synthase
MFTGIVEETGTVVSVQPNGDSVRMTIRGACTAAAPPGSSIAVNGVCLTVADKPAGDVVMDVMAQTLQASGLGDLTAGSRVNLERALAAGGRFDGHIVQGHVDGVGTLAQRESTEHWDRLRIDLPGELSRYVVAKGSIAVDGVSLTVSDTGDGWFEVNLIPTTLAQTTLGGLTVGASVNLEVDVLAKYVERMLEERS